MTDRLGPLMLDLGGCALDTEDREILQHPVVGGVIIFSRNIESAEQVKALTDAVHKAAGRHLLIAVDQEGGRVQRLKNGFSRLPALHDVTEPKQAKELGWLMASEVRAVGCDISFAPVLDLDFGVSTVIGDRSFHRSPEQVVLLARSYIEGMRSAGMLATGKHFPGHGFVAADSHTDVPIDEREWVDIERDCLRVFRELSAELGAVMPAHVIYPQVDSRPAGFSPVWIRDILRTRLNFNGCVFSDDLAMAGAHVMGDYPARARAALAAGCDMVLVCNDRPGAIAVIESLPQQLDSDRAGRIGAMCQQRSSPGLSMLKKDPRWQEVQKYLQ